MHYLIIILGMFVSGPLSPKAFSKATWKKWSKRHWKRRLSGHGSLQMMMMPTKEKQFWNPVASKNGPTQKPKAKKPSGHCDMPLKQRLVWYRYFLWPSKATVILGIAYNINIFIVIYRYFGTIWQRLRWHIFYHWQGGWRWRRRRRSIDWLKVNYYNTACPEFYCSGIFNFVSASHDKLFSFEGFLKIKNSDIRHLDLARILS